tara:strand:+ start:37 stop:360 length:324 start_codon:yes stop_codon:yes gene_type:complete
MAYPNYTVVEANNVAMGQAGSAFLDTDSTTFTPSSGVVVAITMITDCGFDTLTAEGGTGKFINTDGAGAGGNTLVAGDSFPAGMTIYGRWTSVSIQTTGQQCVCYVG